MPPNARILDRCALIALTAILLGGCGNETADDEGGASGSSSPQITTGAPTELGQSATPEFSAVSHGTGWRVTVTVPVVQDSGFSIRSIRLSDAEANELGAVELEAPKGESPPAPSAAFDVPAGTTRLVAEITDNQGRRWTAAWSLT